MSKENKIRSFTAIDIEKYHKGLLTSKERHELEKAALDDPFLADALEGFAVAGINVESDMTDLKNRLAGRIEEEKKTTPLTRGSNRFPALKAAAAIILIAGTGLLVYKFVFNKKSESIANTTLPKKDSVQGTDSGTSTLPVPVSAENTAHSADTIKNKIKPAVDNNKEGLVTIQSSGRGFNGPDTSSIVSFQNDRNAAVPKSVANENLRENINGSVQPIIGAEKKDIAKLAPQKQVNDDLKTPDIKDQTQNPALKKPADNINSVSGGSISYNNRRSEPQNRYNSYRGQVTDVNNNPLPFANITNTRDNVGTYTDARGNFNLISPDTLLDVQVRSLGFNNSNIQLRNSTPTRQVVMEEDKTLSELVLDTVKRNAYKWNSESMKLEEPEPNDGWVNYDTYLLNNLKVPEEMKTSKIKGDVEITFEVNNAGMPVNIKVIKSLCDACDKEAIRLVKEGPKWKRKTKKGRTTVTIPFTNLLQ